MRGQTAANMSESEKQVAVLDTQVTKEIAAFKVHITKKIAAVHAQVTMEMRIYFGLLFTAIVVLRLFG